jgi:hypothetical protein
MGLFFSLYIYVKSIKFFITKNVVIAYKLSTIEGFYHKVSDFALVVVFLNFCHSPKKIF